MTTATILLIVLILAGFSYYKFVIWKENKNYYEKHKEIFIAHKNIGYPELKKETQFRILDYEDLDPIKQLTSFDFVPKGLLDYYITIEPNEYFRHLKANKAIERMNISKLENKIMDGFYVEQIGNKLKYVFNEKMERVFEKEFDSKDKLIKYLVYDRLRMYAPKYKKRINKKYYA